MYSQGTDPVRIFVGCSPNHEDVESQAVLEYTLHRLSDLPLAITWMKLSREFSSPFYSNGAEGWQTSKWATPFSGFRWGIPFFCNGEGRAIYLDSDFIMMANIAELWNTPIKEGKAVVAKGGGRYCCSLWDCRLGADLLNGQGYRDLHALMHDPEAHAKMTQFYSRHQGFVQLFDVGGNWNYTDLELPHAFPPPEHVKAIHYTRMDQQVHLKHALTRLAAQGRKHWYTGKTFHNDWPGLQAYFDELLEKARAAGYTNDRYEADPLIGAYRIRGG